MTVWLGTSLLMTMRLPHLPASQPRAIWMFRLVTFVLIALAGALGGGIAYKLLSER